MIVEDLIVQLQKCPQDWDVALECGSMMFPAARVEPREDNEDRAVFIIDTVDAT